MKFKIIGYEGLNKVAMTKALKEYADNGLSDSKQMTDDLLKNGSLEFEITESSDKEKLLKSLREANAKVTILED